MVFSTSNLIESHLCLIELVFLLWVPKPSLAELKVAGVVTTYCVFCLFHKCVSCPVLRLEAASHIAVFWRAWGEVWYDLRIRLYCLRGLALLRMGDWRAWSNIKVIATVGSQSFSVLCSRVVFDLGLVIATFHFCYVRMFSLLAGIYIRQSTMACSNVISPFIASICKVARGTMNKVQPSREMVRQELGCVSEPCHVTYSLWQGHRARRMLECRA